MIVYVICYLASFLFSRISLYALSGIVLLFAALVLFWQDFRQGKKFYPLRALFSLSFVGGEGISCLKLSRLETDWEPETWICFFLAYVCFWLAFEFFVVKRPQRFLQKKNTAEPEVNVNRLFLSVIGITAISAVSFLAEAYILKYVPLFVRGVPHAYSYFHISGLHYFTVSCVLVPSFAVIWFQTAYRKTKLQRNAVIFSVILSFLIPILCVSRSQLLFSAAAAFATYAVSRRNKKVPLKKGAVIVLCLIPVYILLTAARSHSVSYLNGIFEMKADLPIFLSQPYIYIANNYDNFNCMLKELPAHTFGLRLLYPLWALTGLKFKFPFLVSFPNYVTKTELTTLTLFYDAWYDFGVIGIVLYSALLGFAAFLLENAVSRKHNTVLNVLYAQIAFYLALSFFTTWFSNPATWFYFAETLAVYLFTRTGHGKKKEPNKNDLKKNAATGQ